MGVVEEKRDLKKIFGLNTFPKAKLERYRHSSRPRMWAVLAVRTVDTPCDSGFNSFIEAIIIEDFRRTRQEAGQIIFDIHSRGKGLFGIFTFEVAEQKRIDVQNKISENGYSLRILIDPIEEDDNEASPY